MRLSYSLNETSTKNEQDLQFGILPEKFAIVTCSLLVGVVAVPLLVVIQVLSALFWGTTAVFQLLNGKGLFDGEDEL